MQKVSKVLFVGMNSDDSINAIPPGDYTNARNLISANGGVSDNPLRENTRSTLLRENEELPDGNNTCIGTFEDRQSNRLIYFLHNDEGNHSIWYFDPETNSHILIIQSEYLGFEVLRKITGIGMINDILSYSDGNSPKSFNIQRAIDGLYDTGPDLLSQITLNRMYPMLPPSAEKDSDSGVVSNNISSDGWQFAARYIYEDNESSLFSPLSKLVLPAVYPTNTDSDNYISITQSVQDEVKDIIKRIQFAFVKNNNGEYRIFKDIPASGLSSYTVSFYNTESALTVAEIETLSINSVPISANSLALFKERIFTTLDSYDYQDVGTFSLALSQLQTSSTVSQVHLPGTSYTYGVVVFDEFGRTNGVISPVTISFNNITASGNTSVDGSSGLHKNVTWTISGTPPSWGRYYSIVRKPNNTVSSSCVIPVQVLFYKRDSDGTDRGASEVYDNGQIFHESHQNTWSQNLYLRIPDNTPISIDGTYKVRILQSKGQTRDVEAVQSVKGGNKLVTGNFGITSWASKSLIFLVRLEKYVEQPTELFYEIGQTYTITDGSFDTTTGSAYGDYYRVTQSNTGQAFTFNKINAGDLYSANPLDKLTDDLYWQTTTYSQSPTTASVSIDTVETSIEREKPGKGLFKKIAGAALSIGGGIVAGPAGAVAGSAVGGLIAGQPSSGGKATTISDVKRVFALDYTKLISDSGRAFVEVPNKIVSREPATVAYGERFIPNSKINGLNMFVDGNAYPLSPVRTPIRKIQAVDNVLLAIHEKAATSMYVGEAFINSVDGSSSLTKTTAVVGDDRLLGGGFGTLHPESVVEHDGKAWWFDAYSGEVLRYNNGLVPIGSVYKMKKYFREKGDLLVNGYGNVYGGYDPHLDTVFFTFNGGATVVESGIVATFTSGFENNSFVSSLSPWLQLDPGTSGASWTWVTDDDGAAYTQGSNYSDIIYQNIEASGSVQLTGLVEIDSACEFDIVWLDGTSIISTDNVITTLFPGTITVLANINMTVVAPSGVTGVGFRFIGTNPVNPNNCTIHNIDIATTVTAIATFDGSNFNNGDNVRMKVQYVSDVSGVPEEFQISVDGVTIFNGEITSNEISYMDFVYSGVNEVEFVKTGDSNGYMAITLLLLNDDSETIAFVDRPGYERWISEFDFVPEYYGKINSRFFSFLNGELWEHNVGEGYNNFYGQQYSSSIEHVFNGLSTRDVKDKILRNVSLESNESWDFSCETPRGQQTSLDADQFHQVENTFYADVLRDVNTNPALLKPGHTALRSGREMIDKAFTINIENDSTDLVTLDAINIGYLPFPGQRIK